MKASELNLMTEYKADDMSYFNQIEIIKKICINHNVNPKAQTILITKFLNNEITVEQTLK